MQEVTYYYTDYIPESLKNADFNGDGEVNVIDATLLQKYIVKLETPTVDESVLDLNYDGTFNVEDSTMIMKYVVGIPVSSGKVTVNYYYTDADGKQQSLLIQSYSQAEQAAHISQLHSRLLATLLILTECRKISRA